MESGDLIIGAIILIAVFGIIYYMHKVQKSKENKYAKAFLELAAKENIAIDQHEFWNNIYAIGIDKQSKKVLYRKKKDDKEQIALIDLNEVDKCKKVEKSRMIKTPSGSSKVIDRLDLVFVYKNSKSEKALEFYNGDESLSLRGEVPLIDKWNEIINAALKEGKKMTV